MTVAPEQRVFAGILIAIAGMFLLFQFVIAGELSKTELARKVASGACSIEPYGRQRIVEWLDRLVADGGLGKYALNPSAIDTDTLNLCTEARRGAWFRQPFDAIYFKKGNLVVMSRGFVEVGPLRDTQDLNSRAGLFHFVLLHEIGHGKANQSDIPHRFSDYVVTNPDEREADCWAIANMESIARYFWNEAPETGPAADLNFDTSNIIADFWNLRFEKGGENLTERIARFERARTFYKTIASKLKYAGDLRKMADQSDLLSRCRNYTE
jgi:hypothetical protein